MRFFVLSIIILFIGVGSNAQTTISFQPATLNITSSGQFSVDVWINNVVNITAASITVNFNSNRISYNSTVQGNFLNGAVQYVTLPSPGNPNSILVDQAILGGTSVNGSGKVFTLYFTPKSPGNDVLTISAALLIMPGGAQIPFTTMTCNISINIPILVSAKVLLQGCYNLSSNNMNNNLNSNYLVPLNQPFSNPPWNYYGTESVTTSFYKMHRNIVDWVLVELRTGISSNTKVGQKAGFLLSDGTITALDGDSPLSFNLEAGNYYLIIRHRNHLAIMSGTQCSFGILSNRYDFTTGQNKAYGLNPMVMLSSGVYGMTAGDANGDGYINGTDFNIYNPKFIAGSSGYLGCDWNMDGIINGTDFNMFNANFIRCMQTQIPNKIE